MEASKSSLSKGRQDQHIRCLTFKNLNKKMYLLFKRYIKHGPCFQKEKKLLLFYLVLECIALPPSVHYIVELFLKQVRGHLTECANIGGSQFHSSNRCFHRNLSVLTKGCETLRSLMERKSKFALDCLKCHFDSLATFYYNGVYFKQL